MVDREEKIRDVSGLLHDMGLRLRAQAHRHLAENGFTLPMAISLNLLDEPMPMSDLAERLNCEASYMTGIADRLEVRGLVERVPDHSDRRVRLLQLTPRGAEERARMRTMLADATPMLERLAPDELDQLAALLHKAVTPED
jgi:DNA-binding MarR family transcriptional regulator